MKTMPSRSVWSCLLSAGLLFGAACAGDEVLGDDDDGGGGSDELADLGGDIRLGSTGLQLPAGEEVLWCMFGRFEVEAGVQWVALHSDSPFMHHMLMRGVPDDAPWEDGEVVDCLQLPEWWAVSPTLFEAVGKDPEHPERWVDLPEGVAFMIHPGQRWVLDSHFVNPSLEDAEANVGIEIGLVAPEVVEHVAGTFNHDAGELSIPAGGLWSLDFDCAWETEVTVLGIGPHMHGHGSSYSIDWIESDGSERRILEVPEWEAGFQTAPPGRDFAQGEVVVQPGDSFKTTCTWDNQTGAELSFPDEMCTTFGVGYPLPDNSWCEWGNESDHPAPM